MNRISFDEALSEAIAGVQSIPLDDQSGEIQNDKLNSLNVSNKEQEHNGYLNHRICIYFTGHLQ